MSKSNNTYPTNYRLTFADLYRRVNCSISHVCCSFSSSVQVNRQTMASLNSSYSNLLEKLEEIHTSLINQLNLTATKNAQLKEIYEKQLKDFGKELESLEAVFDDINNLPSEQYSLLVSTLQELRKKIYFQRLGLKAPNSETVYFELFEVGKTFEKPVWTFMDPNDGIERSFMFGVEKQLERGFTRNSCNCKLMLEDGQCFGYADFNAMQLECLNPKKTLKLIRKQPETIIINF